MALPIDSTRLQAVLPATEVVAVPDYGPEVNGQRQRIEGGQGRDKVTGVPMWNVSVLFVHGDGTPPELARVKVVSYEAPDLSGAAPFSPVFLQNLTATAWIDGRKVSYSYKCTGVDIMAPSVTAQARKSDAA